MRFGIDRRVFAADGEGAGGAGGGSGGEGENLWSDGAGGAGAAGDKGTDESAGKSGEQKAGDADKGSGGEGGSHKKDDDDNLWGEGGKGDDDKGGKDGDGGEDAPEPNEFHGAPEGGKYEDFTFPEGQAAIPELVEMLTTRAAAMDLNQAGAQELINDFYSAVEKMGAAQTEANNEAWGKHVAGWDEATAKGVKDMDQFNADAMAGVRAVNATAEELDFLRATKYSRFPLFRRMAAELGRLKGDHRMVDGGKGRGSQDEVGAINADRFYGGGS
ncbi:MAG: hypothetical protein AAF844_00190 [Pseudomonadota bacterium]